MIDSILPKLMPSSIKMSRTVILRSSKIGCSTSRMLPGVMLVRDRRSCLILDGLRRSLNILAHLNSSFTQALITDLISQTQKNILFLTFSHSKKKHENTLRSRRKLCHNIRKWPSYHMLCSSKATTFETNMRHVPSTAFVNRLNTYIYVTREFFYYFTLRFSPVYLCKNLCVIVILCI